MKYLREVTGTEACMVGKIVDRDKVGWKHSECKMRDCRGGLRQRNKKLQKTRNNSAKMGGFSEEREMQRRRNVEKNDNRARRVRSYGSNCSSSRTTM